MKSDDIRSSYLEFFRARGHVIERSDTLVPSNDPSLLFTSAGMVQFKPYYTGEVPVPYRRAATAQKCLRAGGKANDLDEVGKTSRHCTFFEMMGNFSFGDYFKQEAIAWAWEYSTQVLKLDPDLIWVTVYEEDDEAFGLWEKEIGVPARKISRLGAKDNFWGPAGDTGACGPCSELHIDRGESLGCGKPDCGPGCERCERFMEFWNLVFPQYDQQLDGSRPTLKNRGIDTGMGLERVAALLQGKETVFDTDGIYPIIQATEAIGKAKYTSNPVPFRVIADHVRALSFMIADGILPGNEGRGYVERRLLRRGARFGREIGFEKPFLYRVVQSVIDRMGHQYPELVEKRVQIEKIVLTEEERFASTLVRGMDRLEELFEKMRRAGEKTVPGAELFRMHDTFGFPLDLATDIAVDRGFQVDVAGFDAEMEKQRERGRQSWDTSMAAITPAATASFVVPTSPAVTTTAATTPAATGSFAVTTSPAVTTTEFVGYETLEYPAKVAAVIRAGQRVASLEEGEEGEVVLDRTPFYAESGGQVGDTGTLDAVDGSAHVFDTKTPLGKAVVHKVRVVRGRISTGDRVSAAVNAELRSATEAHHTATHLLQAALRETLGTHVHQAGSMVSPERLRFDFTHFEGISGGRLQDIERLANQYIRGDLPVSISLLPLSDARQMGAMALFGEKYEDTVRVVKIEDVSLELCGGCHVKRTGVIGYLKILGESSVASGVRRIEAVCGEPCVSELQARDRQLTNLALQLTVSVDGVEARVQAVLEENRRLEREVLKWKQAAAVGASVDYMSQVREVKGVPVLAAAVEGQDAEGLRMLLDNLREKLHSGVLVLASAAEGKAAICAAVTKDLTGRIKAGDIVKRLAPIVGGGGGGRPDMAQAGGKNPENVPEAIAKAYEVIESLLQ